MFKRTLVLCGAALLLSNIAHARTANDIIQANKSPEEIGLEIAKEVDARDLGFGDFTTNYEMILRNAYGQETKRQMRGQTLEVKDPNLGDRSIIIFDHPRDVEGTAFLTHSKILDPDDQWLYLPALRRIKRISSKNKSGPFMGSEFAYEDISSQEVGKYNYKYLRNESCGKLDCMVVERYPLYENSGYTKLVTWIDVQEFRPQKVVFYDRKNTKLKTLNYEGYQQYLNKYWRAAKMAVVNHQTKKSTDLLMKDYKFKIGLKPRHFVKSRLKNIR